MEAPEFDLSDAAVSAIRAAASASKPREIQTGAVVLALIAVDSKIDWGRLRLLCGIDEHALAGATDARLETPSDPALEWQGAPASHCLLKGLHFAAQLAHAYDMAPIQPGLLALALFATPGSGAAQSIEAALRTDHEATWALLQDELVGGELTGLDAALVSEGDLFAHTEDCQQPTSEAQIVGRHQQPASTVSEIRPLPTTFGSGKAAVGSTILSLLLMPILAVVLILGVVTSQGFARSAEGPHPSEQEPPLASSLLDTAIASKAFGTELVLISQGPPTLPSFLSSSPFALDLRNAIYDQAWERRWEDPASSGLVALQLFHYRSRSMLSSTATICDSGKSLNLDHRATAVTAELDARTQGGCLDMREGRTQLVAYVTAHGRKRNKRIEASLGGLVAGLKPLLRDFPDTTDGQTLVAMPNSRRQLLRAQMLGLLGFVALVCAPPILYDRSTYERLTSRWRRRRRNTRQLDAEPQVARIRLIARALAWVRLCLLVWAVRLSEMSGIPNWAVLLVAFVLGLVIQRFVMSRIIRPHRQRLVRGTAVVPVVFGVIAGGAIAAASLLLVWLAVSVPAVVAAAPTEWRLQRIAMVAWAVAVPAFLMAMVPVTVGRRLAMRRLRRCQPHDERPPVLLLRSFADDRVRMRARLLDRGSLIDQLALRRWESFEEVEAAALAKHGPVYAVATPGELLPPALGAVRKELTQEDWQSAVAELAESASLIAVTLGRSEGLVWECTRIRDAGLLHKAVFLIPPVNSAERQARLSVLAEVIPTPWGCFDTSGTGRTVLAVCWPLGSVEPLVVTAAGPDDIGYDLAIWICCQALGEGSTPEVATCASSQVRPMKARSDVLGGRRPPVAVIPRGMSKPPGRWRRLRRWARWAAIYSILIGFVLPTQTGSPFGRATDYSSIGMQPGYAMTLFLGQAETAPYVLLNGGMLVAADLDKHEIEPIAILGKGWIDAGVLAGSAIWDSSSTTGEVGSYDLTSRSERWRTFVGHGIRSVAISGSELIVADPARRTLTVLSATTGRRVRRMDAGCRPWDVTVSGPTILAVCPDSAEVVAWLEGAHDPLRLPVAAGASRIFTWRGEPYVFSAVTHKVVPVHPSAGVAEVSVKLNAPLIATNGKTLAIEGFERVSVITGSHVSRWYLDDELSCLGVTPSGQVLAGEGNLIRIFDDSRYS